MDLVSSEAWETGRLKKCIWLDVSGILVWVILEPSLKNLYALCCFMWLVPKNSKNLNYVPILTTVLGLGNNSTTTLLVIFLQVCLAFLSPSKLVSGELFSINLNFVNPQVRMSVMTSPLATRVDYVNICIYRFASCMQKCNCGLGPFIHIKCWNLTVIFEKNILE